MPQLSYRTADHGYAPYASQRATAGSADWNNAIRLVGRILIGGIFVYTGLEKLTNLPGFAGVLAEHGVPWPSVLAPIGAAVEFGGGLLIVLGLATRYAALMMIAFVVVATAISHRFWEASPSEAQAQIVQFIKNVEIIGGYLFVLSAGGGEWSLERFWRGRQVVGRV